MKARMLAALALLALGANQAGAQSTSISEIANFRWQLSDLDPHDGILPSLIFLPMNEGSPASIRWEYRDYLTGKAQEDLLWGGGFPGTALSAAPSFVDEPHLQIDLAGTIAGTTFADAIVQASAYGLDKTGQMTGTIRSLSGSMYFTLSPHTAVSFLADASLHSTAGAQAGPGFMTVGNSFARMWLSPDRLNWSDTYLEHVAEYGKETGSGLDQPLIMRYANTGPAEAQLGVALEAVATVATMAGPVPEPASWAMLLAGLAIVAARRAPPGHRRLQKAGRGAAGAMTAVA